MTDFPRNDPFLTHQQQGPPASYGQQQSMGPGGSPSKVPLVGGGKKVTTRVRGGTNAASLALLIFLPWLMHTMVLCLFTFPYHHFQHLVWALLLACLGLSGVFILAQSRNRQAQAGGSSWYLFLGVLCIMACLTGTLFGLYNYHKHMFSYWAYDEFREYNNVLPSEPAAAHADAGKLVFSKDAMVDTTKAVGFKQNDVYCVAPILDDTQAARVEFWAAGLNCCGKRAEFNCDDAWDPKAKAGVVVLDDESWLPSHHDTYMKAVKIAEAAFDLVSAEEPIFVRWVIDPERVQDDFWKSGVGFLVASSCVYLVCSVIFGVVLHHSSKPKPGMQPQGGYQG